MSESDNKHNSRKTSHEQRSFGPKDRPVTPKPAPSAGASSTSKTGSGGKNITTENPGNGGTNSSDKDK